MATELKLRRGTTEQNEAFTGAQGELSVDIEQNQLRLHDGNKQGGYTLVQENLGMPDYLSTFAIDKSPAVPNPDGSIKLLEKLGTSPDDCYVYIPKRGGGEFNYIGVLMRSGIFTTSNSAGSPAELIRALDVLEFAQVVTWLDTVDSSTSTDLNFSSDGAETHVSRSGQFASTSRGNNIGYHKVNAGGTISYRIPASTNLSTLKQRRANVAFLTSGNSAASGITIDVNGSTVTRDFGLQSSDQPRIQVVDIDLPYSQDSNAVDLVITVNNDNGSDFIYVIGADFYYLSDMEDSNIYTDAFRAFGTDVYYRDASGANDYAIYDAIDDQWIGSFHGGETRTHLRVEDGTRTFDYINMADGDIRLCTNLRFFQITDINSKMTARSYYEFPEMGGYYFRCYMDGEVVAENFYTCMNTTHPEFNFIEWPRWVGAIDNSAEETFRIEVGDNSVVQYSTGESPRKSQVEYTLFRSRNTEGVYVRAQDGNYNKVYYGPVEDQEGVTVNEISFATRYLFS